jgi:hypothetical protein
MAVLPGARLPGVIWRRGVVGLVGVWGLVGLARATRLIEPAETPPGQELIPILDFLRQNIPNEAGYLYVLPGEFGTDTGTGPRLRYELYPRRYDDIRASVDEARVRELIQSTNVRFVVVPDASQYLETSWLRQPRDWLRQISFDPNRYLLEVVS